MDKQFIVAVDFDGTIVDHAFPKIGGRVPGAIEYLKDFNRMGMQIILWTCRGSAQYSPMNYGPRREIRPDYLNEAVYFIESHGVDLWDVNNNLDQHSWTDSQKIYADVYIDDKAIGVPLRSYTGFQNLCVDWRIVGPKVIELFNQKMGVK